jgi:DNA-binding winged helix-turn-helix (wHTH) protein/tetratricopeptide (TPR) repeat protein
MSGEIGQRGNSKYSRDSLSVARETVSLDMPQFYEFGPFRLEPSERKLLRGNEIVVLTPKAFDTLLLLVRNSGHLLEKGELIKMLWPDTFVEEGSLSNNIFLLRKALGEDPAFIETVPRRGYRFVGPLRGDGQESAHATSEKAASYSDSARHWKMIAAVAIVVAAGSVGGMLWHSRRSHKLTEKDTIVLADFSDATGDPVFDDTLKQGLRVQLEQSPFLGIVSEQRIQQTLRLMGRPADARLTPEIARELCQRTGRTAVINGSIAHIGTRYSLILRAVDCPNGESLTSTEAEGSDKSHVLDALGKAASQIRNMLGESLSTVQKFDTPLEQDTTSSLEALQAYSLGRKIMVVKNDAAAAVPLFQRAIRLDPNFAMAYARLGTCYLNLEEPSLATESTKKAYELRERVSEREKFYIESHYYQVVTGDLEKARRTYELWIQVYPRDPAPHNMLGSIYGELAQEEKALEQYREAVRMEPNGMDYSNLVEGYITLNRIEEARATIREAQAKNFDSPDKHVNLYMLAFLQKDAAGMTQQVAWSAGKPGVEDELLGSEANTAAYFGRLRAAREFSRRAVALAEREEEKEAAASYESDAVQREALFGNAPGARKRARAMLALATERYAQCDAALVLALAGDAARTQALTDDLAKRFPEDTELRFGCLPTLHAQLALNRNEPSKAIDLLQAAAPTEIGIGGLYPAYVRGEAYLAAHEGIEAAAEFRKILDHRGIVLNSPIGAVAHLGLARAYALQGDTAKAKAAYHDFLTLWKDADPDIPILIAAKSEYAKLK